MSTLHLLAVFALSYGGMFILAIATERHYADYYGRGAEQPASLRLRLRLGGTAALALGLAAAIQAAGVSHGMLFWLGALTASCLVLVLLLSYALRLAALLGVASCALGSAAYLLAGVY